jgi:hypothetical protein
MGVGLVGGVRAAAADAGQGRGRVLGTTAWPIRGGVADALREAAAPLVRRLFDDVCGGVPSDVAVEVPAARHRRPARMTGMATNRMKQQIAEIGVPTVPEFLEQIVASGGHL